MGFVERPTPQGAVGQQSGEADGLSRWRGPVGAPLEEIRSRLLTIASRLEPHLDTHALPLLTEAQRQLRDQTCRIAVIGQIKAGKSSFINAFTQRPELLPTDVNPWTAVVTMLHFRNDRPPPEHAAVFHLFSRDEWQRLADGGGPLRELTERLVPGFKPELLRAQLEVMRQRAQGRLGADLEQLLGQVHRYETVTPEILDDYVSAGVYLEGGTTDPQRRQYSDITRTAELFFNGGPFAYPVTLVDTPGTNDPFLVRDEITRRSLENSDIYIFVISALQPLSATDISLLRILNGLHKDRIVVYVNRIDQLRNPVEDAEAVKKAVKARLEREFPALSIPVVTGSAWWGGLSLAAGKRDLTRVLPAGSINYLRHHGLPANLEITPGQPLAPADVQRLAKALYAGSGMQSIAAAITELLAGGSSAVLLRQLAACFLELARSSEISAKMELQAIIGLMESRRAETRAVGERILVERQQLASLDEPIRQIQASFALIERQLNEIVRTDLAHLDSDLKAIIDHFSQEECRAMVTAMRRRDHDGQWRADLNPLREQMENRYVEVYRATESRIIQIERVLYPQLRTIIEAIVPGSGIEVHDDYPANPNPYPSASPLSETVVLDLDLPWWKMWFAARPDPHDRAADLARLIHADFGPMAEEMVREAQAQFAQRISLTLQQAHAVSSGMLTAIQERKSRILADYDAFSNQTQGQTVEAFEADQQERARRCTERQSACSLLGKELAKVLAYCQQTLLHDVGAP